MLYPGSVVPVEETDNQTAIIVGCSVGAAVVIAIMIMVLVMVRNHEKKTHPPQKTLKEEHNMSYVVGCSPVTVNKCNDYSKTPTDFVN